MSLTAWSSLRLLYIVISVLLPVFSDHSFSPTLACFRILVKLFGFFFLACIWVKDKEGSKWPAFVFLQRLSNGSIDSTDDTSQIVELQELLEKQNYEMAQMKERLTALSSRVGEVEQEAETARKDLIKTEEMNTKYQRDIREVGG